MIDLLLSLIQFIIDILGKLMTGVISLLPSSPFSSTLINSLPFIDTLNWVIPFRSLLSITELWVSAIFLYLGYSVILRWVKVIR